jgi:hypothetical protein
MTMHRTITKSLATVGLAAAVLGGLAETASAVELRAGSSVKQIAAGNQDTAGARARVRWEDLQVP